MSTITIIICVLTVVFFKTGICASVGNTAEASPKVEAKIYKNVAIKSNADKGQFPYQVQLQIITNTTTFMCGGTIVSKLYVVTAARCFYKYTVLRVIVDAGNIQSTIEWNPLTSEQTVEMKSIWIHPNYNSSYSLYDYDLAIITLGSAFVFNQYVAALPLPSTTATFEEGASCTITGWGTNSYSSSLGYSSTLQYASVNIVSQANCTVYANTYWFNTVSSAICTRSSTTAPCDGDFGGPVICTGTARDGSTKLVLAGIISQGCSTGIPLLNTRVSSYSDLINNYIGGTSSTTSPCFLLGAVAFICAIKLLPG